jgi:hypothetical protein
VIESWPPATVPAEREIFGPNADSTDLAVAAVSVAVVKKPPEWTFPPLSG